MLKKFLVFAALLLAGPTLAQNVQYVSPVTRNHIPVWNTNGVIADGGSSADSPISSLGVTNEGGAGFCVSSQRQTAAGRNQLCFGAATAGPATISLQNFGNATPQNLQFIINGAVQGFPTVSPLPVIAGNQACFSTTAGGLKDCGVAPTTQFSITSYGAIAGGSAATNSTAVTNAIAAATSAGGGCVYVPLGTFQYSVSQSVTASNVGFCGVGRGSNLQYTGSSVGISYSGNIGSIKLSDLTLSATNSSATILQTTGINQLFFSSYVYYVGGGTQVNLTSLTTLVGGSFGIHFVGGGTSNANTAAISVNPLGASVGLDQAVWIDHFDADGFTQYLNITGLGSGVFISNSRLERHIASTTSAISITNSFKTVIANLYVEDDASVPFLVTGANVGGIELINNYFGINILGGTHVNATVMKTSADARSITVSNNWISIGGTVNNVIDTGGSPIYGRDNTFADGIATWGFASTAGSASVDIDANHTSGSVSFSSGIQQVGVGRMALDYSNATGLPLGTSTIASGACGTGSNGTIVGTNRSGQIAIGASATTTCTISFSAAITAPNACVIFPQNATAAAQGTTVARVGTPSTTQWVITGSALASANYAYICL